MNILVIGSGGREHAVIKALSQSAKVNKTINKIYCSPGNAGLAELASVVSLEIKNHWRTIEFCKTKNIDLVFIGPEEPLVDGLADSLRAENVLVFGPSKQAAQLEGSKIFAKKFMQQAGVPTAKADIVDSVESTLQAAKNYTAPYVLKADGLAAGKGVFICADLAELTTAAENIFVKKILGEAGSRALLEENLQKNSLSKEISLLVLTNGAEFQVLPLAQDHKRLLDHNLGPNTGGMGAVAPIKIEKDLYQKIIAKIVKPSVDNLKKHNYLYRGVLFIGLMIVDNEPFALEYNVRFGDPETQVILPLIENDLAELFSQLSQGRMQELQLNSKTVICIVNAAEGYPDKPVKGAPITLPATLPASTPAHDTAQVYILHAGTALNSGLNNQNELVATGGRVLNVVAVHDDFTQARASAYELNNKILFSGRQFRTDIGADQ